MTSDLSGTVYFHWYAEGAWVGRTVEPSRAFAVAVGDQLRVEVIDTTDEDFDPVANAPEGYPARRTLWWTRSTDADVRSYKVEEKKDAGSFVEVGSVRQEGEDWTLQFLTGRLDDLADYTWRITPIDAAGNEGTALTIGPETIVRRPDSPSFAISYDGGTNRVTVSGS